MIAAVIPIKSLNETKSRLKPICSPAQRAGLCIAMLGDMLKVIKSCKQIDSVYIITPDDRVNAWVGLIHPSVGVIRDNGSGLNDAAELAGNEMAKAGHETMLFLHGDLPNISARDVGELTERSRSCQAVLVPDTWGRGTTGLVLSPPNLFKPVFGENSFPRHLKLCRERGYNFSVVELPTLSADIDTPEDLCTAHAIQGTAFAMAISALTRL